MSLRHAVLGLLSHHPASGYELAKHFKSTLTGVWYARNHQLYPELGRLAEDGFVEVVEEGPRGRRTYSITDLGRTELRRWLVEVEPDRSTRSETYLRAFLLATVLGRDDALTVLDREMGVWEANRAALQEGLDKAEGSVPPDDPYVLATTMGVRLNEAMLDWAHDTISRIREHRAGP
ncbi:PadR family transcriptional regulator [Streptomyces sp. NBC_01390]|uniref:PadR family transcriptional regulator n=1 Tax=Streptomyces sp. NBC_01390 TaxID=2903850 RepID=UPI0032445996